jgi:serpin B
MDKTTLLYSNNTFCLNIFKVLLKEYSNKNIFLSPISIEAAVAMTLIGARNKTAQEMNVVFSWDKFYHKDVHQQFREYFTRARKAGEKPYKISLVNRVCIENTFSVEEQFMQETKRCYFADPVLVDLKENADEERKKINTWVADQTQGKIQDLLVPGILNADSRMVLINAMYFKGKWDCPFLARDTVVHPFKVSPNKTVDVQTMTGVHVFGFTKDSSLQCTALELVYEGNDFSMVIILPDDDLGLEALVQKLDVTCLDKLLTDVANETETIFLHLPKFEMTSAFALKHPLTDMGMPEAFSTSANFSGISNDRKGLRLSNVIHKSFLQVDEKGTEAATATAAIMIPECDVQSTPMIVDHPFLFTIIDRRYKNLLLFWGQITDPSVKA